MEANHAKPRPENEITKEKISAEVIELFRTYYKSPALGVAGRTVWQTESESHFAG
jgi:hypothetical protein